MSECCSEIFHLRGIVSCDPIRAIRQDTVKMLRKNWHQFSCCNAGGTVCELIWYRSLGEEILYHDIWCCILCCQ